MHPRNRRRVTGRTNLKQHNDAEAEKTATKKRLAKAKQKEQDVREAAKKADEEVVDRMIVSLQDRFNMKGSMSKSFKDIDSDLSGNLSKQEFKSFFHNLGYSLSDNQVQLLLERTDKDFDGEIDLEEFASHFDKLAHQEASGFSNVNASVGELDNREEGGGEGKRGEGEGVSTSGNHSSGEHGTTGGEHDDVSARVQIIISQLKRKVAQKGSMRTVFREYDANHDGSISSEEFRDALNNLNLRVTDRELNALLKMVDSHHTDGKEIMYDDFCAKFGDEPSTDQGVHFMPDFTSAKHKAAALTPKLTELATRLQSGSGLVCYAKILKAFRDFDSEKAGFIARDDFRMAIDRVSRLGATTGVSSSVAWEGEVDDNGGYVDYVAFVERLRQAGVSNPAEFWNPNLRKQGQQQQQTHSNGNGTGNGTGKYNHSSHGDAGSLSSAKPAPWITSPMQRPTRFQNSAALRYKNTSYITVPQEGSPSYVGHEERFTTIHQGGIHALPSSSASGHVNHVNAAKADRIRRNQARIEQSLKEEATRKMQQESARIDSLSTQRQNYLDRVNQASFQKGRFVRTQVGVSQTNILTGLTE